MGLALGPSGLSDLVYLPEHCRPGIDADFKLNVSAGF